MKTFRHWVLGCGLLVAWGTGTSVLLAQPIGPPPALEQQLKSEGAEALARAAREQGDATRGALVFYQPSLSCTRCHLGDDRNPPLGPDLATLGKESSGPALVEAILDPSKTIRKGYETVTIVTKAGKTVSGRLVAERPDAIVLREAAADSLPVTIPRAEIDERSDRGPSLMPAGLANQLTGGRREVLDLVRYLMEIAEHGPARALALRPDPALLVPAPLPDYERTLDHAGLIAGLNRGSFTRGEEIYSLVCVNCHGTKEKPGSLPTSLRFASGSFKNGSDPYSMYQTLTRGFGQMAPQTWMVPSQKYDVIHYIREAYLKDADPDQYARVDRDYLARLPRGTTRGPAPRDIRPWVTMDYGPSLMATLEIGDDGANFAYKGIAVRLDAGQGGVSRGHAWSVYDHDTLRLAATWTGDGFIDWNSINFNGKHEIHPRIVGMVQAANPTGPGWANPVDGRFDDPRPHGRDGRPYGPLPRSWAHYRGLYHHGGQAILAYSVGETPVLEMPGLGLDGSGTLETTTRTFELGPRPRDLVLEVAHLPGRQPPLRTVRSTVAGGADLVVHGTPGGPVPAPAVTSVSFDGTTRLDVAHAEDFDLARSDYTISVRMKTRKGGTLFARAPASGNWAPGGKALFVRRGRLVFDIGWVGSVSSRGRVDDDRWHDVAVVAEHQSGKVRLYIDGRPDGDGTLLPTPDVADHAVRIGYTAADFPGGQTYFDGRIAELWFYQRALARDEVAAVGREGDVEAKELLARWNMDDARAGSVPDAAGRSHDGRTESALQPVRRATAIAAQLSPPHEGFTWLTTDDGHLRLKVPAGAAPLRYMIRLASVAGEADLQTLAATPPGRLQPRELEPLTHGGPPRWAAPLATQPRLGTNSGPFAVDVLSHPEANPWLCQMRFTGFDFDPGGQAMAVCTWDGDVWRVEGIDDPARGLLWRRIASGLFQPLGLKIVDGAIHVGCRDQICILRDLNGDGETDFYENFNSDHQVTEHFHEFAMDLETDPAGNFYYAKAARHGKTALVPQHGTLLRVSRGGARTDILATGFRAPNGVCVNPDGTFYLTDQEGFWTPKNRINWVKPGGFYGNMWGYHDVTDPSDSAMEQPLCWITNAFDRSPAQIVRVVDGPWGPLAGSLLNLSYGYGKIFVVPHEIVLGQIQGGMAALPIPQFPTGLIRGRFHPASRQLYTCGMYAWAGTQTQPGGLYRVRATGKPVWVPIGLSARKDGVALTFSAPLERAAATEAARYAAKTWGLKRSEKYGSDHLHEMPAPITAAALSDDGRMILLTIPELAPTQGMEISYAIKGADGTEVNGSLDLTIHHLRDPDPVPAARSARGE